VLDFSTRATSTWYGAELRALADLVRRDNLGLLSLTAGANVEFTQTESTASSAMTKLDKDFNIAGVYAEATSELTSWLAVTAGGRFDRNSLFESKASPRAALFLRKGEDYGVKFLYAQGFRNPSIFEAYYADGARFQPALVDGKSSLHPETITAYEVVAYGKPLPGVKLRVSLWDWIMPQLLKRDVQNVPPPVDDTRFLYENGGTLESRGAEVESSYRDAAGRYAYANVSLSFTGRNCLGDTGLGNFTLDRSVTAGNCDTRQNAPVFIGKAGLSSQLLAKLFYLSGELRYISERGTQDTAGTQNNNTVAAYTGLDLVAYAPDVHGVDVTLGARNLVGREQLPAQSDYNRALYNAGTNTLTQVPVYETPGPGRTVFVRVGYRF